MDKTNIQFEVLGTIDELQATLGVLNNYVCEKSREHIVKVQEKLFIIGSIVASKLEESQKELEISITSEDVSRLVSLQEEYSENLPELNDFVIPGGTKGASFLHVARTVCRRGERKLRKLHLADPISEQVLEYINQLSNVLFVFARYENNVFGSGDVLRNSI